MNDFISTYYRESKGLINTARKQKSALNSAKSEVTQQRKNYFEAFLKREKAERVLGVEDDLVRQDLAFQNLEALIVLSENAKIAYFGVLEQAEIAWKEYESSRKGLAQSLEELETSRAEFIKHSFLKILKGQQVLFSDTSEELKKTGEQLIALTRNDSLGPMQRHVNGISVVEKEN